MANTEPPVDTAADVASLREQAREQAAVPVGFLRLRHPRHGRRGADRDGRARARPARSASPTTGCRSASARVLRRALQYQRLAGRPLALHEEDPDLLGRRGSMHEGVVSAGARDRRHPLDLGVDDDRPRRGDRRLRGRADPRPAPVGARVGGGGRGREGGRGRAHLRGDPAPPDADRRGGPEPRRPLQDEPAAALRGRPPGADRGPALGRDRLHRDRSRAALARREGGPVRAGGDGRDRARDGLRGPLHRAGAARGARPGDCWSSG